MEVKSENLSAYSSFDRNCFSDRVLGHSIESSTWLGGDHLESPSNLPSFEFAIYQVNRFIFLNNNM